MKDDEIEFTIIESKNSKMASAHVGVRARHISSNVTAESTEHMSQYLNKEAAIQILKQKLKNKI